MGLISRNIKLTAQISGDEPSRHWGGEIKIVKGFAKVEIQGVEIEKFGKDQLGSYPIHIHEIGDVHRRNRCWSTPTASTTATTNASRFTRPRT